MSVDKNVLVAQHKLHLDTYAPKKILMVVANPSVNPLLGWPVGFWAAELAHPYYEFTEAGFDVTVASPNGGKVEVDALSDPRDPSKWSIDDILSLGFLESPLTKPILDDTAKLGALELDGYDAIVVCGGQSPMFTFRDNADLQHAVKHFYESNKLTAAFCHGVSALADVKLQGGDYLVKGRPSPALRTSRKITVMRSSGARSCRGASRTHCGSGERTMSRGDCSNRFACGTVIW